MSTDLTFITNEKNKNLSDRFKVLIKDTKFFDVLVGYFYTSGFYAIYKSLETTEKLRILIGISTNRDTYNLIQKSYVSTQESLQFSHAEAKEKFSDTLVEEMGDSEDNHDLIDVLSSRPILKSNKIIIFTESKETAEYVGRTLQSKFPNEVLTFWGGSSAQNREQVIENA